MNYFSVNKAAKLVGQDARHIRRLCAEGELPGAVKDGNRWRIPESADPRLAGIDADAAGLDEVVKISVPKRQQAMRRLGLIKEAEKFAASQMHSAGCGRSEALAIFAKTHRLGVRSLQRWIHRYRSDGFAGLVDGRGGGNGGEKISPEAFEYFKGMYLTEQRRSVKTCLLNVSYINKRDGRGWQIPSLRYMQRYVREKIPLFVRVLYREGIDAYIAKCAPYIKIDPDSVEPGQVWVGDHHQLNCWVRHRNRWVRPWLTAWQDMRSRALLGWHISTSPNQTTILLAMRRAIKRYGAPESVKIDNGRDYDSQMFTGVTKTVRRAIKAGYIDEKMVSGLYAMMGISASFAIKYRAQSKPIERMFDTVDMQFSKSLKTYCGKDAKRRPEALNSYLKTQTAITEAYTLDSFAEQFTRYPEIYNNTAHHGNGMHGRSPANVLVTRQSRRQISDDALDLLCRVWSGELKVGKNGVRFKGLYYGQYDAEVLAYQGKPVRVSYDPDDIRSVHIYDAVTMRLVTIAEQARLVQYGRAVDEESLRYAERQKAQVRRAAREYRKTHLVAGLDLTDLTLKAMADAQEPVEEQLPPDIRPVITPLDGQVKKHKKLELAGRLKKAAGAEQLEMDIDLSLLGPDRNKEAVKLGLFNEQ
ncbi:MAG TPA: DDE-type integrase/transposase/recombinase [Planctomycetes bacterium]|nr:DDE-type integrase/transposase/recombinase [Planctomycetota bacterium]